MRSTPQRGPLLWRQPVRDARGTRRTRRMGWPAVRRASGVSVPSPKFSKCRFESTVSVALRDEETLPGITAGTERSNSQKQLQPCKLPEKLIVDFDYWPACEFGVCSPKTFRGDRFIAHTQLPEDRMMAHVRYIREGREEPVGAA